MKAESSSSTRIVRYLVGTLLVADFNVKFLPGKILLHVSNKEAEETVQARSTENRELL
jgi:hypothetical protein